MVSDKPGQPTAHQQALDSLIDDMARQINAADRRHSRALAPDR